jgi:hypothetical protein
MFDTELWNNEAALIAALSVLEESNRCVIYIQPCVYTGKVTNTRSPATNMSLTSPQGKTSTCLAWNPAWRMTCQAVGLTNRPALASHGACKSWQGKNIPVHVGTRTTTYLTYVGKAYTGTRGHGHYGRHSRVREHQGQKNWSHFLKFSKSW